MGECAPPPSLHSNPPYHTRHGGEGRPAIIEAELCADDGCEDEGNRGGSAATNTSPPPPPLPRTKTICMRIQRLLFVSLHPSTHNPYIYCHLLLAGLHILLPQDDNQGSLGVLHHYLQGHSNSEVVAAKDRGPRTSWTFITVYPDDFFCACVHMNGGTGEEGSSNVSDV